MSAGVRGHDPLCPIARETWAVWTGDKCDYCRAIGRAREESLRAARDAVAAEHESASVDYSAGYLLGMKDALAAIDALQEQS